jgi:hypothetical protein
MVPLFAGICDARCTQHLHSATVPSVSGHASHPHTSAAVHVHGHHHEQAAAKAQAEPLSAALGVVPSACAHDAGFLTALRERASNDQPTSVEPTFVAASALSVASSLSLLDDRHSPPSPVRYIAPLRI